MNASRLAKILRRHATALLDTCVLVYHLDATERYADLAARIVAEVAGGDLHAQISVVTVTELLAKPFEHDRQDVLAMFESFLGSLPNLSVVDVTYAIAREAARLRGQFGLRTPDALVLATGIVGGTDCFVTNDKRLRRGMPKGMRLVLLDDYLA